MGIKTLKVLDLKLSKKQYLPKDQVTFWDSGVSSSWKITAKSDEIVWWLLGFVHTSHDIMCLWATHLRSLQVMVLIKFHLGKNLVF